MKKYLILAALAVAAVLIVNVVAPSLSSDKEPTTDTATAAGETEEAPEVPEICQQTVAAEGEEIFLAYDAPEGRNFFGPDSGVTTVKDAKDDFYEDVRRDPARLAAYIETKSEAAHKQLTQRFLDDREFWQTNYRDFCRVHENADRVRLSTFSGGYETQTFTRGESRDEIPQLLQASPNRPAFTVLTFEWVEDDVKYIAHYRRECDWQVIHEIEDLESEIPMDEPEPEPEPEPTPTPTPTPTPEEGKCFKDGKRVFDGTFCGTPDDGPEQQDRDDPGRTDGYEEDRAEDVTDTQENPEGDPNKDPTDKGSKSGDYPNAGEDTVDTDGDGQDDQTVDDSAPGGTSGGTDDPEHHSGEEPSEQPTNSGDPGGW